MKQYEFKMNKLDLIKKIKLALDENHMQSDSSIGPNIEEFIDALVVFESKMSQDIFFKIFIALRGSIFEDSSVTGYFAAKNAIFGDFNEIRGVGFYNRYIHNVRLTSTYLKAYQLTEDEYVETFGRKRYSSYDSFRIIRNRRNI